MTSTKSASRGAPRKTPPRTRKPAAEAQPPATTLAQPAQSKLPTKGDLLITLMRRPDGVTAAQMGEASGWQIHSVRGFIAGSVKKKLGLVVATEKVDGETLYRIVEKGAGVTNDDLDEEVQALERLDLQALRAEWRRRWGEPPKLRSRELLAYAATDRLQTKALGGLSSPIRRRIAELARRFGEDRSYRPEPSPKLTPGCSLVREWGGARHVIQVTEDGLNYQGEHFSSLSKVAQHITGAKRSGLLFFGLKEKARAQS